MSERAIAYVAQKRSMVLPAPVPVVFAQIMAIATSRLKLHSQTASAIGMPAVAVACRQLRCTVRQSEIKSFMPLCNWRTMHTRAHAHGLLASGQGAIAWRTRHDDSRGPIGAALAGAPQESGPRCQRTGACAHCGTQSASGSDSAAARALRSP